MGIFNIKAAARAVDSGLNPVPRAKRYIFSAGTDSLCPIYKDSGLTTLQTNPMISDSDGNFGLCYVIDGEYRVVVEGRGTTLLYEQDNVVISSAFESGKVRGFRCVADLIDDTVLAYADDNGKQKVSAGDFLETIDEHGLYRIAAPDATDHQLVTGNGVKLYIDSKDFVTPAQFGASGTGDETAYVQAAFDSGQPVLLDRFYRVTGVHFPDRNGFTLHGLGANTTGLIGTDSNADYILQTFHPAQSSTYRGHHDVRNFGVLGDGIRAVVIGQTINTLIENLHLISGNGTLNPNHFRGTDGFVFEESFGNIYRNLQGSGLSTGTTFKVNSTCLDSIWDLCYTNNAIEKYSLDINNGRREVANIMNAGFGRLNFNMFTAQGAKAYAIKIVANEGPINFNGAYFENCQALLFSAGTEVNFNNVIFTQSLGTPSDHCIWIDKTDFCSPRRHTFTACTFPAKDIVLGDAGDVQFVGCSGSTANGTMHDQIKRALSTYIYEPYDNIRTCASFTPEYESNRSVLGLKCQGSGGYHTFISVDESGTISAATPYQFPSASETPQCVFCGFYGSSSPNWPTGVAINPVNARGMGGTGAALTYGYLGSLPPGLSVDPGTGQLSGTPTVAGSYSMRIQATDGTTTGWSRPMNVTVT